MTTSQIKGRSSTVLLALVVISLWRHSAEASSGTKDDTKYQVLLSNGDKLLLEGRSSYQKAVSKYTEAILMRPNEVRGIYRRAELYNMMKEHDKCLSDLETVIRIDPNHRQSLNLRATLLAVKGNFLQAAADMDSVADLLRKATGVINVETKVNKARMQATSYRRLGNRWEQVQSSLANLPVGSKDFSDAKRRRQVNRECVDVLKDIIAHTKESIDLRLKRATCAIVARHQAAASEEIKYILTRDPNLLAGIALNVKSMRLMGASELAKKEVKRCLQLDPEYEDCIILHKSIKKYTSIISNIDAEMKERNFAKALKEIENAREVEVDPPNEDQLMMWACEAYVAKRDIEDGHRACAELLEMENGDTNPSMAEYWILKAELHLMEDDTKKAEEDFHKAAKLSENNEKVREFRQKLDNLKRSVQTKDYYKMLGVKKSASETQIRRAYRKLARLHHPDQYASQDLEPKERERKNKLFRDLNEAKEVLLDNDKRRRYDAGEDVMNPQQGHASHHQFHGFPGGFPGGGFQFPGGFHGGFHFG
eukprot:Tbor_TRINITY_DN3554_c0_g1::TRINITY_DN3554_c0_g1_i2::g.2867::m.2867/K09523/DNAJC3; DnaJ homolog subfamily C member 3